MSFASITGGSACSIKPSERGPDQPFKTSKPQISLFRVYAKPPVDNAPSERDAFFHHPQLCVSAKDFERRIACLSK